MHALASTTTDAIIASIDAVTTLIVVATTVVVAVTTDGVNALRGKFALFL